MLDLSEESVEENIATTAKYFKRMAPMGQWLEMEIGITGGEEDGVDNSGANRDSLFTSPEVILEIYKTLGAISPNFSIAAGFGNVHGVYKPGNVSLEPYRLFEHQKHVYENIPEEEQKKLFAGAPQPDALKKKENKDSTETTVLRKPVFLVFHGGSGSDVKDFQEAISKYRYQLTTWAFPNSAIGYGVVKVNLDTDLQWAYLTGIRDYIQNKKDYLVEQVGNPEGADKPNKKYYDPRVWVREGEKTMSARVAKALDHFKAINKLKE